MGRRVNGTSVECTGWLSHSTAYQGSWNRARISNYMIHYMIIESIAIRISWGLCESQVANGKRWELTFLWDNLDNLVGSPKSQSPVEQTGPCLVTRFSCRIHGSGPFSRLSCRANGTGIMSELAGA